MARPKGTTKPIEEVFITRSFRFPPSLWERFEGAVGERERSRFLRRALELALDEQERDMQALQAPPVIPGSAAHRMSQLVVGADGKTRFTPEALAETREEVGSFYATDPEALEWLEMDSPTDSEAGYGEEEPEDRRAAPAKRRILVEA